MTVADFERIAMQRRARTSSERRRCPVVHPKFLDPYVPGVVTVIVVPETDAPNPFPNETTLRAVCA